MLTFTDLYCIVLEFAMSHVNVTAQSHDPSTKFKQITMKRVQI